MQNDFASLIKIHDSEPPVRDEQVSHLHVAYIALKFANALNKPPLKLSLSYQGPSTF